MPPNRIFIVRHGERIDHINAESRRTMLRPHDSPLTPGGHKAAFNLGAYLRTERGVTPTGGCPEHPARSNVIVLSSPLQRCVETSHGIIEGLLNVKGLSPGVTGVTREDAMEMLRAAGVPFIPLFLEPGVAEGPYWMNYDMKKAVKAGNTVMDLEQHARCNNNNTNNNVTNSTEDRSGTGTVTAPVAIDKRLRHVSFPVFMHPLYHVERVSPFVQPTRFRSEGKANKGNTDASSSSKNRWESSVYFSDMVAQWCPETLTFTEEDEGRKGDDVQLRVIRAAQRVAVAPALEGKTVIIVGHGQTTAEFFKALTTEEAASPYYTAWCEIVPSNQNDNGSNSGKWKRAEGTAIFGTPHLPEELKDSPGHLANPNLHLAKAQ